MNIISKIKVNKGDEVEPLKNSHKIGETEKKINVRKICKIYGEFVGDELKSRKMDNGI